MRCLDRHKRWILVSLFEKLVPVKDDEGRLTGNHVTKRSRQIPVLASVSAVKGAADNAMFGQSLDYDRTVIIDDPNFNIEETAVLWIDGDVEKLLADGGYFEKYTVYESGNDLDGGNFIDYSSGDKFDAGGFEYPVWTDQPHDYVVKKVGRSDNYTIVAVKRVEVSR